MIQVIKSLSFHDDPDMTIEELNLKSHYMDLNKKKHGVQSHKRQCCYSSRIHMYV